MRGKTLELSGWGRYPRVRAEVVRPEYVSAVDVTRWGHVLARGLGRSYGDAALSKEGVVLLTERLNRFLEFDERTGLLRAEAGATIAEVLEVFAPRGWFPPVTPGTKFVTLGGCVAADVHGKNHHRDGAFGAHVEALELLLADGARAGCTPAENSDLFGATVGGMGLTGVITEVTVRLKPVETSFVIVRHHASRDLAESLAMLDDPVYDDEYTVCWVDLLARGRRAGRGVLIRGQHARALELPREFRALDRPETRARFDLPFDLPSWALNRLSASAFNRLYFSVQGGRGVPFVADFNRFFYPLDAVGRWNRAYGKRGFVQYQCVMPLAESARGLARLQEALAASRQPCFLAVLKRFGPEGTGLLSFPAPGYTLALDFPVRGEELFALLRKFDDIVLEHGGRVYLAKDACLDPEKFRLMYPRFPEWLEIKRRVDPGDRFRSELSRRLGITP
ncbi:MAG TPA: FAD-binding oxidoreductase [Pyrinomonadaceae bacterium]|nr:FAD-binding oxidoreductase [Pyrinomonadaceae bacterium]